MFNNQAILSLFEAIPHQHYDGKTKKLFKNQQGDNRGDTGDAGRQRTVTEKVVINQRSDDGDAGDDGFHRTETENIFSGMAPLEAEDCQECIDERSAIMQFDGGLSEAESLAQATVICMDEMRKKYRR